jgi:hypothetical protein
MAVINSLYDLWWFRYDVSKKHEERVCMIKRPSLSCVLTIISWLHNLGRPLNIKIISCDAKKLWTVDTLRCSVAQLARRRPAFRTECGGRTKSQHDSFRITR